ncbi:lysozyme [Brevundimonas sp.]|uniref:lysozyme n=1 Tax=Brevundimonas sp. TaxID=1871086 RepID=UPI002ABCC48D|nr:glycoside hydrolase family protein [Brevundimonas sp.]MDZ4364239.1 glycoside hydrolase family protein [Brevundimonas sp.]
MKVSREGVVLIKGFEGFRPHAVQDEAGRWTIGYDHTLSAREGLSVSEGDAELLLQYDLLPVVQSLNASLAAPVNQHQFDALASFAFSIGLDRFQGSDVLARLNAGSAGEAADALIGWPDPTPPQAAIRRRAAERALFVADPAVPVTLADLMAAPLPPPVVDAEPEAAEPITEDSGGEAAPATSAEPLPDARSAALATLLGEPIVQPSLEVIVPTFPAALPLAPEPAPAIDPEPAASPVEVSATAAADTAPTIDAEAEPVIPDSPSPSVVDEPAAVLEAAPAAPPAHTGSLQFQRYTPYAAPMFGPLPTVSLASPTHAFVLPASEPQEPADEVAPTETPATEITPLPEAIEEAQVTPEPMEAPELTVEPEEPAPVAASELPVVADADAAPVAPEPPSPFPAEVEAPIVQPLVVQPSESSAFLPVEAPVFMPAAEPGFALTPSFDEEPLQMQRPLWDSAQRSPAATVDQDVLFEDEPALASVMRHEEPEAPRRFDWSETGAFLIMGGVGLASCAASAAAFRLAAEQPSPMGETTVIAWVLALIGIVCVGASSWNLYLRWTGPKGE